MGYRATVIVQRRHTQNGLYVRVNFIEKGDAV